MRQDLGTLTGTGSDHTVQTISCISRHASKETRVALEIFLVEIHVRANLKCQWSMIIRAPWPSSHTVNALDTSLQDINFWRRNLSMWNHLAVDIVSGTSRERTFESDTDIQVVLIVFMAASEKVIISLTHWRSRFLIWFPNLFSCFRYRE